MVDDHTKLNQEMAEVADSIGLKLPRKMDKDDQAEYDKLNSLSGEEFDKEYITYMVKDHHEDLREFRMDSSEHLRSGSEDCSRQAASQVIREHMVIATRWRTNGNSGARTYSEARCRGSHSTNLPPAQ